LSWLPLTLGLAGQAVPPPPDPDKPEESPARLAYMKKSVTIYSIHPADDRSTTYRLISEPVLRYSNPVGQSRDGAIFLWTGAQDRPEVAVQVSVIANGFWSHQCTSLSTRPLVALTRSGPVWKPRVGGVQFQAVPGSPRPAEKAEARLRQMRALAEGFATEDNFQGESWQKLRLMAKPFHRYGKEGTESIDGSVFCFALGTDPELFLMIEARPGADGPGWHYAFAPITVYELKASYKGKEVWASNGVRNVYGQDGTIVGIPYSPEAP
jgi:hypothetical protein